MNQQKIPKFCIFNCWDLANGSSESNNPQNLIRWLNEIFQMQLNIFTIFIYFYIVAGFFSVIGRKYKEWAIFDILMTITPGVNMMTKEMTRFFSSTLSVAIFHFWISETSKFISMGPYLCIMFWFVKYAFTSQKMKFSMLLI